MFKVKSDFITFEEYLTLLRTKEFLYSSLYHESNWLLLISNSFNCEIVCVKSIVEDSTISIVPFLTRKIGPFKLIGSALRGTFTEFLGPLFKSSLKDDQKLSAIESQIALIAGKYDYIEFRIKEDKTI